MSQVSLMLLDSGRHYLLRTLGERIKDRLRKRLYTSILQQEIGFFDANGKGELMSMLGEDVSQMQMAVTDRITSTLTNLTTVVFGAYKVIEYAHHLAPKRSQGSCVRTDECAEMIHGAFVRA
jgi:ATP-binding cassette subfamily B (MDR/TAP) protein 10